MCHDTASKSGAPAEDPGQRSIEYRDLLGRFVDVRVFDRVHDRDGVSDREPVVFDGGDDVRRDRDIAHTGIRLRRGDLIRAADTHGVDRGRAAREHDASRADALIGRARDFLRPGVDEKLEQVPRHIFRRLAIPLPAAELHWCDYP